MPELRQNLATKEWVIIATERAKRPEEFIQADKERIEDRPVRADTCPFCPGNEELDLERLRLPATGDWQVRVVANRYPALHEEGELVPHFDGLNRSISGVGYHEVVVESRLHNTSPATETVEEIELTLQAFQMRGQVFSADPRIDHLIFFKNHGVTAGASLVHPHAQMLGLPVVPLEVRSRISKARQYYEEHQECVMCRMRHEEEIAETRLLASSAFFSAFIPYAAFSPFHFWIVPRRHCASFLDITPIELRDLAELMRTLLGKVYIGLNDPDYNYVVRSYPENERGSDFLHWYVAVVPRLTRAAGFELGTGMYINTALPEASAKFLRSVKLP
jgi:UDPglucose--hexose-1-phosphate uridylyltransferase